MKNMKTAKALSCRRSKHVSPCSVTVYSWESLWLLSNFKEILKKDGGKKNTHKDGSLRSKGTGYIKTTL